MGGGRDRWSLREVRLYVVNLASTRFVARIFVVSTAMEVISTKAMMKRGGRFEIFVSFLK